MVRQSQRRIILSEPHLNWEEAVLFRLTYEGLLFASRTVDNPARAAHKQDIRRVFHKQLKELWQQVPHLKIMPHPETGFLADLPDLPFGDQLPKGYSRASDLASRFKCGPYNLVPLVTQDLALLCGLDILLLRPGNPGAVLSSGDVDNRVKTLIDALRIPGPDTKELGGHNPQSGENPFYCLLENDGLINHLAVEADRLLEPVIKRAPESNARVVITVKITPAEVRINNLSFA